MSSQDQGGGSESARRCGAVSGLSRGARFGSCTISTCFLAHAARLLVSCSVLRVCAFISRGKLGDIRELGLESVADFPFLDDALIDSLGCVCVCVCVCVHVRVRVRVRVLVRLRVRVRVRVRVHLRVCSAGSLSVAVFAVRVARVRSMTERGGGGGGGWG
eukprot:3940995-Rhodomonas_salina.1